MSCKQLCCKDCNDIKVSHNCHCHVRDPLPNLGSMLDQSVHSVFYLKSEKGRLVGVSIKFHDGSFLKVMGENITIDRSI